MTALAPTHLLVPVDLSKTSAVGLRVAASLAARFEADLTVLHVEVATAMLTDIFATSGVMADTALVTRTHHDSLQAQVESFVEETLGEKSSARVVVTDAIFVAEAIVKYAEDNGSDWIVMGATGHRAFDRLVLGSSASEVVRRSHVPVLTLRAPEEGEGEFLFDDFRNVLVAVDLGEGTGKLIDQAAMLAHPRGKVTVMHVVEALTERGLYGVPLAVPAEDVKAVIEWTETALARHVGKVPDEILEPFVVRVGRPGQTILAIESELQPDVTVIGTHGRHGADRLALGSVAERVAVHARGPVLVVPTGQS